MSTKTLVYSRLKRLCGDARVAELLTNVFELQTSGKKSKYNNMKISYQGEVYHSLSEAYYSYLLNDLLRKGKIKSIDRQKNYPLENMKGKKTMRYSADFVVVGNSGTEYIIDVKGRLTPDNKIKYAYFRYVYKKEIILVMTTGVDKFTTKFLK